MRLGLTSIARGTNMRKNELKEKKSFNDVKKLSKNEMKN
jgi:hypothetical protein